MSGFRAEAIVGGYTLDHRVPDSLQIAEADDLRIHAHFRTGGLQFVDPLVDVELHQRARLQIVSPERVPFADLAELVRQVRNFFSFAVRQQTRLLEVTVRADVEVRHGGQTKIEERDLTVYFKADAEPAPTRPVERRRMLFRYEDGRELAASPLSRWLAKRDLLGAVYDLYLVGLYQPRIYLELQFVSLAQALESLHSRKFPDLQLSEDATFAEALAHPIVPTFRQRRSRVTAGGETVGSMHATRPLHLIRHRHDHRALTWWDEDEQVVWLCAYGFHRSGEPDDAYALFHELIDRGDLAYPDEQDYARAFRERQRRFNDLARREAPGLVARARARMGRTVTARLARTLDVRVQCVAGTDVDELYIAFPCEGLDHRRIVFILRAFTRGLTATDWEWGVAFPENDLTGSEMSFLLIVARDE